MVKHLVGLRTLIVCVVAILAVYGLAVNRLISGAEALYTIVGALTLGGGKGVLETAMGRRQARTRAGD
jgi:hypothetical protein